MGQEDLRKIPNKEDGISKVKDIETQCDPLKRALCCLKVTTAASLCKHEHHIGLGKAGIKTGGTSLRFCCISS